MRWEQHTSSSASSARRSSSGAPPPPPSSSPLGPPSLSAQRLPPRPLLLLLRLRARAGLRSRLPCPGAPSKALLVLALCRPRGRIDPPLAGPSLPASERGDGGGDMERGLPWVLDPKPSGGPWSGGGLPQGEPRGEGDDTPSLGSPGADTLGFVPGDATPGSSPRSSAPSLPLGPAPDAAVAATPRTASGATGSAGARAAGAVVSAAGAGFLLAAAAPAARMGRAGWGAAGTGFATLAGSAPPLPGRRAIAALRALCAAAAVWLCAAPRGATVAPTAAGAGLGAKRGRVCGRGGASAPPRGPSGSRAKNAGEPPTADAISPPGCAPVAWRTGTDKPPLAAGAPLSGPARPGCALAA